MTFVLWLARAVALWRWLDWRLHPTVLIRMGDGISFLVVGWRGEQVKSEFGRALRARQLMRFRRLDGRRIYLNPLQVCFLEWRTRP